MTEACSPASTCHVGLQLGDLRHVLGTSPPRAALVARVTIGAELMPGALHRVVELEHPVGIEAFSHQCMTHVDQLGSVEASDVDAGEEAPPSDVAGELAEPEGDPEDGVVGRGLLYSSSSHSATSASVSTGTMVSFE